jgi:hypothetical protein
LESCTIRIKSIPSRAPIIIVTRRIIFLYLRWRNLQLSK